MRLKTLLQSKRLAQIVGGVFLVGLAAYGALASAIKPNSVVGTTVVHQTIVGPPGGIQAQIALSQSKVVQGSDGEVYVKLTLTPDSAIFKPNAERKPTDFVVVLDRSGSMSEANKMDFAHKAIESLLYQMTDSDRFTLVTFDNVVETPIQQVQIKKSNRNEYISRVRAVSPRGGTNLASGLEEGVRYLKAVQNDDLRVKRVILISDGMANVGVIDPHQIGSRVKELSSGQFAISTIGVGLDYNEQLLANVADYGLGNYHYLEKLADLDKVLSDEFNAASQVVVQNLELTITGTGAVTLVDASGYPIESSGSSYTIRPGHLYAGQDKVLYLTYRVPTQKIDKFNLGRVQLSYTLGSLIGNLTLIDRGLSVACLPPEKNEEVRASINKDVYGEVWQQSNYGRFMKDNSQNLSNGDSQGFLDKLAGYKKSLKGALDIAPSEELQKQYDELEKMDDTVSAAAPSPAATKSLGKQYHSDGIGAQRKSK